MKIAADTPHPLCIPFGDHLELLRKGTNSKWELQLDDKDSVFYGIPVLNGGRIEAVPICPLTNITALLSRRTGEFLKNADARLAAQPSAASR